MPAPFSRVDYLSLMRKHVRRASGWTCEAGTDFWMLPSLNFKATALATAGDQFDMVNYGFLVTSVDPTAGSAADLMTSADRETHGHYLTNASGDLLASPAIFGDYWHAFQAMRCAGLHNLPRVLAVEFVATWSVASANEAQSAIGFYEDGATVSVQADQLAVLASDGTNFRLINGVSSTGSAGPLIDTVSHLWRIELNLAEQVSKLYQDDVYQCQLAIETDEFPCQFGFHVLTTNRLKVGWVHVYYDW